MQTSWPPTSSVLQRSHDRIIETDRLILRNWRDSDVEPFIQHTNTPAVMRWLGGVKPEAELRRLVEERFVRWQEELGFTFWVVERKSDNLFLGACGLKVAQGEHSPVRGDMEIGIRLRKEAWGAAYAEEAATASIDFAFARLQSARVVGLTVEENRGSVALMQRIGMRRRSDLTYVEPNWPAEMNPVIVFEARNPAAAA